MTLLFVTSSPLVVTSSKYVPVQITQDAHASTPYIDTRRLLLPLVLVRQERGLLWSAVSVREVLNKNNTLLLGVFAIFQNSVGLENMHQVNLVMKPTSAPAQGQPNPRRIGFKVAFGPLFPAVNTFFRGLGLVLYRKQTTRNPTQPNSTLFVRGRNASDIVPRQRTDMKFSPQRATGMRRDEGNNAAGRHDFLTRNVTLQNRHEKEDLTVG